MAQYDVDLRDYWRIIRKRKATILAMVLLVGFCSYGFAKWREPSALYEASSAIKIDRFSNLASIMTGGYWRQAENMETHAYIITSYPVLRRAVEGLGWVSPGAEADSAEDQALLESIQRLKRMVEAKTEEGTHIIKIQAVSDEGALSARAANMLAQAYRDYNIQQSNKKTFETKAFIEEQMRLTLERLKQAEQALQHFKEQNGLIALDTQTANTLNRLNGLELEYERAKVERVEIEHQLKAVETASKGSNEKLAGIVMAAPENSPLERLRSKLGDLHLKRETLLVTYTDKHPLVEEVASQIQAVYAEARKDLQSLLHVAAAREGELLRRVEQVQRENMSLPEKGLMLARLQREVDLQQSLYSQLKAKYQEVLIQESGKLEEVSVVKPAIVPAKPFNIPSKLMIVLTGVIMGLILGVVLAFLAEVFDTSMGTIEDVEELLKVPVLGVIPQLSEDPTRKGRPEKGEDPVRNRSSDLVTHYEPKSQAAESFRALRANLQFLRLEVKGKLFLITSSFVQEGKTLNVVNLALSMAQTGHKVLLVDADLRKPSVHRVFGLQRTPGLTDCVLGNYSWREVVGTISDVMLGDFAIEDILKTPGMDNLHFMTAGTKPPNPTEILSSERFRAFLQEAKQSYDFIFVDAPPILPVADATEIAPWMDGVFLVYTVGRIGRGVLKRAKSNLDNVEAKVLGIILNNVKPEAGPDYFRYHSHYYYGPDASGPAADRDRPENRGQRWPSALVKAFGLVAFVLVLSAFTVGVFWHELPSYLPDWLLPYARTLFSN